MQTLKVVGYSALFAVFSVAEAFAMAKPPGESGGGHAPEIDGPAGLAAIALVGAVGLYLYNRYKR